LCKNISSVEVCKIETLKAISFIFRAKCLEEDGNQKTGKPKQTACVYLSDVIGFNFAIKYGKIFSEYP